MMFENGNLDPVCFSDPHESGLLPGQIDNLDKYLASNERCKMCGQRFNSDPTIDELDDDEDVLV